MALEEYGPLYYDETRCLGSYFKVIPLAIGRPVISKSTVKTVCDVDTKVVIEMLKQTVMTFFGRIPDAIYTWILQHAPLFAMALSQTVSEYHIELSPDVGTVVAFSVKSFKQNTLKFTIKYFSATVALDQQDISIGHWRDANGTKHAYVRGRVPRRYTANDYAQITKFLMSSVKS